MPAKAVIDTQSLQADEESAKILAELKNSGLDLTVSPLAEQGDKKGADIIVRIYHAFDGRYQDVPLYMTSGEGGAMSVFKYRFTDDQIKAVGADPKWVGKQVWFATPQPNEMPQGSVLCRFSVELPKEHQDILKAQGFNAFCRKDVKFLTEAQEDLHAKKRHPKWYEFMEKKEARANMDLQRKQTEALMMMAEKLSSQ